MESLPEPEPTTSESQAEIRQKGRDGEKQQPAACGAFSSQCLGQTRGLTLSS